MSKSASGPSNQVALAFMEVPDFEVPEAMPTAYWHPVVSAKDIVEEPEWALYCHMRDRAVPDSSHPESVEYWGIVQISLAELGADLNMPKSSLQRSLRRLREVKFIDLRKAGQARGNAALYRVYSIESIEQIVRGSRVTHYCKLGGARKLYRAIAHIPVTNPAQAIP